MGTSIILLICSWFWVPEIKGLSTEELDELYERRIQPRYFAREMERIKSGVEELRTDEEDEMQRRDNVELKEFRFSGEGRVSFGDGRG